MSNSLLNPASLAKPSGYTHGVLTTGARMLFLSGQPGMDGSGRVIAPGDLVAQFTQALSNLQTVVQAAGGSMTDIVKLTFYVTDKDAYKAQLKPIGVAYRSFFGNYYPASTLLEVKNLYDDNALIEIDGIAVIDSIPAKEG